MLKAMFPGFKSLLLYTFLCCRIFIQSLRCWKTTCIIQLTFTAFLWWESVRCSWSLNLRIHGGFELIDYHIASILRYIMFLKVLESMNTFNEFFAPHSPKNLINIFLFIHMNSRNTSMHPRHRPPWIKLRIKLSQAYKFIWGKWHFYDIKCP